MSGLAAEIESRVETPARAEEHALAVRSMFDRISPTYDVLNKLLSLGIDRRWRRRAIDALLDGLPDGVVVDLCAGTLDLTAALVGRGRRVVALDFAREMLVAGRHAHKDGGATLAVADAMRLPLGDASVAGIVCGFGMRNVADPRAAAREARRVLAPGGALVVLEFYRPERAVTRLFHATYAHVVLPLVGRVVSRDREAYGYLARSMRGFLTRREHEDVLREAGFDEVSGVDLTLGVASIVKGVVR